MLHYTTSTLTTDDKRQVRSALPSSTCHIFAMARGQIFHAPFTTAPPSEWEPLDLRGAIVFGRDMKEYEIKDDASSGGSSRGSLVSAGTGGSSGNLGPIAVVNEEFGSAPAIGDGDSVSDLAGGSGVKDENLWFRLVEIGPHEKKTSKVVWRQPVLSASSDYQVLVPSFHAFSGNSRRFGFKFEDAEEAHQFSEAVMVRIGARPLVKPAPGLHPWNKSARRRKTKLFFPTIKQTADPESGKLQFKTHAGTNEKGGVANEGGIVRKPTFLFGEHPRQRSRRSSTVLGSRRLKKYLQN